MESKTLDLAKDKPIEYLVVAVDRYGQNEEVFRTIHLQGFRAGAIGVAIAEGRLYEGRKWKRVWVWYRVKTVLGQYLDCIWNAGKGAFQTREGDVLLSRKWIEEAEEYPVENEKDEEEAWACLR